MRGLAILSCARSRSSMTAMIFRQHGCFFGDTSSFDKRPAGKNEHPKCKKESFKHRKNFNSLIEAGIDPTLVWPGFGKWWLQTLKDEGYNEMVPWGLKTDPFYYDCMKEELDPVFIKLWRPIEDIVPSMSVMGKGRDWQRIAEFHHEYQSRLPIPEINTDLLVKFDFSEIIPVFETLGMTFDETIARKIIKPGLKGK